MQPSGAQKLMKMLLQGAAMPPMQFAIPTLTLSAPLTRQLDCVQLWILWTFSGHTVDIYKRRSRLTLYRHTVNILLRPFQPPYCSGHQKSVDTQWRSGQACGQTCANNPSWSLKWQFTHTISFLMCAKCTRLRGLSGAVWQCSPHVLVMFLWCSWKRLSAWVPLRVLHNAKSSQDQPREAAVPPGIQHG